MGHWLAWLLVAAVGIAAAAFLFYRLWFCRMPHRTIPADPRLIVSPATGKVVAVRRFGKASVRARKWNQAGVEVLSRDVAPRGWFILIMMTPLDVHYQRAPITGRVLSVSHEPGGFRNAVRSPERLLTLENERNSVLIQGRRGRVKVVQIAGVLARRISCYLAKDQKVDKGALLGFISLGSQVALLLPESVVLSVAEGERVTDGESVIGAYP